MRIHKLTTIAAAMLIMPALSAPNANAADNSKGKDLYGQSCASCHGPNGKGAIPGLPDFTSKNGVLAATDAVLTDRITKGYQGPNSPMAMPPLGGNASLTHDDVVAILAYMRQAFGVPGK